MAMESGCNSSTPQMLVDGVLQLISLPQIYLRLQKIIDNPWHTREQVADIIAYDPSLAARILRIAKNSYANLTDQLSISDEVLAENRETAKQQCRDI
ncbi:MAG: HDOD domain-containing protein [Pseudomonadales bacterium]